MVYKITLTTGALLPEVYVAASSAEGATAYVKDALPDGVRIQSVLELSNVAKDAVLAMGTRVYRAMEVKGK